MKKCSIILLSLILSVLAQEITTGEFLSNDLYDVSGSGTTVIYASPSGVSWCSEIDTNQEAQVWKNIAGVSSLYGDNADQQRSHIMAFDTSFLLRLVPTLENELKFLFSSYEQPENDTVTISYIVSVDVSVGDVDFDSYGGVAGDRHSWVAAYDAGIVEIADTGIVAFHIPDSSTPVVSSLFNLETRLDTLSRPLGVDFKDSIILSFSENRIWTYDLSNHQWDFFDISDTLSILSLQFSTHVDTLFALVRDTLFATKIVQIDRNTKAEMVVVEQAGIASFSVADNNNLYIIYGSQGALTVRSGVSAEEVSTNIEGRKDKTNISSNYSSRKVFVGGNGSETFLSLSTDKGGLYSWNEYESDSREEPLMYIFRSNPIASSLKQVLAVPSILHTTAQYMTFEYALSEGANVTIDIFNSNFEFLCRITEDAYRNAGADQSDGRSTNRNVDRWDGTVNNNGGKTAPPGIYFFRISTDKGDHQFGKCIVAKN